MQHLVSALLWWIFTGCALWAWADPVAYADLITYRYVQRHGRLPSTARLVWAAVVMIGMGPLTLLPAIVGMVRGAVR